MLYQKNVRLDPTYYFTMKYSNKREHQQIAFNASSDFDLKKFMNLYKQFTVKLYSFLAIGTTFISDNPLRFGKNF